MFENDQYADDRYEMESLFAEGKCCSQIMLKMFEDATGLGNNVLTDASSAFCNGLYEGRLCGALVGGVLMLSLSDKRLSRMMIPELTRWFEGKYGHTDCGVIAGAHGEFKTSFCMDAIQETYYKALEIIDSYDIELPE